jgi:hypothetical protein
MHSLIIEQRPCPRCANRRTGRFWRASAAFCFHCRLRWDWSAEAVSRLAARPRAV